MPPRIDGRRFAAVDARRFLVWRPAAAMSARFLRYAARSFSLPAREDIDQRYVRSNDAKSAGTTPAAALKASWEGVSTARRRALGLGSVEAGVRRRGLAALRQRRERPHADAVSSQQRVAPD